MAIANRSKMRSMKTVPTVREIESEAAENDYRMSSFILGVVKSPAFRMARADALAQQEAGQ